MRKLKAIDSHVIFRAITFLLIFLWVYAAVSKLADHERSQGQMLNQVFTKSIALLLVWAIPAVELLVVSFLMFSRTMLAGLYASALLLGSFTVYIGLIMNNIFGYIPCSCGGIFERMSWGQHLVFNLFFLLLNLSAILISVHLKEGGLVGKE